jgi:hypothetical protein
MAICDMEGSGFAAAVSGCRAGYGSRSSGEKVLRIALACDGLRPSAITGASTAPEAGKRAATACPGGARRAVSPGA